MRWCAVVAVILLHALVSFDYVLTSKLNARRVLIPYNIGVPTNFTLEVNDGGCYQWTSSRPDVALIQPNYDLEKPEDTLRSCSKSAKVTVASHSPRRLSSIVVAKEVDTGLSNRVDIEVDVIKEIEIVTRTKEIALDDVPEIIEVRAMNAENDTFSSLGGIEFEWVLEPVSGVNQARNNLRFKKFSESSYGVPPDIEYWESRDSHGPMVLIQGTKTGASRVRAKIKDSVYKTVPPAEITLVVIANLLLIPSHNVYLIPHSTIKYNIELIKSGETQPLLMPSEQYYLEISNPKVAKLDPETATVTALAEGMTELILKDRNIKLADGVRQPTAEIHIRRPSYLTISVTPGGNFALQELSVYVIGIQIFDDYHHRIYPSDNLNLQITFPSNFFNIEYSSPNGTYNIVKTLAPGSCKLKAKLIGAFKDNREVLTLQSPLELEQEVKIYPRLAVMPPLILLPWDTIVRPTYVLYPRATGATGFYHWESTNPTVAGVNFLGESKESSKAVVKTFSDGNSTLIVTDIHNTVFRDTLHISIQPVNEIEIISNVLETQLGSSVFLPLALYGFEDAQKTKRRVFDDCSQMPIEVEVVEKGRFVYVNNSDEREKVPAFNRGCRTLRFDCSAPGHSRIFVRYSSGDSKINLQTTTVISCHLPLKLIHPQPFGLLALGTSIELTFEGGPRTWPLYKEGHYTQLAPGALNVFETSLIADPYRFKKDLHVFKVTCKELGETELELVVGNIASPTLPNPAVEKVSAKVGCLVPTSLHLRPKLKADDNCPLSQATIISSGVKLPISSTRNSEIEIFAKDAKGRKFHNITSLFILWQVSDYSLAVISSTKFFVEEVNAAAGYRRLTRNYQSIMPTGKEGDITIETIATGYRKEVLEKEGVKSYQDLSSELKAVALLSLVDKPVIKPEEVLLFNHKRNKVFLQLSKGSGHFLVEPSSSDFAALNYSETSKTIGLSPLKTGSFFIKVTDCCVDHGLNSIDAVGDIKVVYPKQIKIKMPEKLELKKEAEVFVRVLDNTGSPISALHHDLMGLQPVIGSDITTIKLKFPPKLGDKESIFVIKAEKLGKTTIVFQTLSGYDQAKQVKAVISPEINIHVFVPLKIVPSNLTLVVGSIFQITVIGGPQPDAAILYKLENEEVASISGSGIMNAFKIGSTKLIASAVGHNSVLYSQDEIIVQIVALTGIKINSPGGQLLVGSEMPLYISGLAPKGDVSLSPFSFASVNPPFRIRWSVSNKHIIKLKGVVDDAGLSEIADSETQGANLFSVRAYGIQAGSVSIKCTLELEEKSSDPQIQQTLDNEIFHDEIQIRIYPELKLILPSGEKDRGLILMSPGSELQLKTTRQGFAKLKYSLRSPSNKIKIEKGNILKADDIDENILLVTAQEEFSAQQSASYRIVVKPVSYLMLKPVKTFYKSPKVEVPLINVPIGSTVRFGVNYYDSNGLLFDAALSNLNVRPNRYDLIDITASERYENNSLTVKILKEGTTIIKAWDTSSTKDSVLEDYIYIRSGHAIYPVTERSIDLTVGDIVCFKSPLTTPEGQLGQWEVEGDEKSLFIDPSSGVGLTHKAGLVRARYNLSTFTTTSLEINVHRPKAIHLDSHNVEYLTQSDTSLVLPIIVERQGPQILKNHHCGSDSFQLDFFKQNIPFLCELALSTTVPRFVNALIGRDLSPEDLFSCQIDYNPAKNAHEVHLIPQVLEKNLQTALSSVETNITIMVFMRSYSRDPVLSTALTLPFYPNFHVAQRELILSDKNTLDFITLSTTPYILSTIQIMFGNGDTENAVDIYPPEEPKTSTSLSSKSSYIVQIPIQIRELSKLWQRETNEPLSIKIWSSLLRQTRTVIVKIAWSGDSALCPKLSRPSTNRPSKQSFTQTLNIIYQFAIEYYQILLTSFSTCLFMFVGYHILTRRSRRKGEVHHPPSTSSSPFSPAQRRVLSFRASPTPNVSSFNLDSSVARSPTIPRVGRPLWSERSS